MNYRERERAKVIDQIKNTNLFNGAKSGGIVKHKGNDYPKDEILIDGLNNIYEPIRDEVMNYFNNNKIA